MTSGRVLLGVGNGVTARAALWRGGCRRVVRCMVVVAWLSSLALAMAVVSSMLMHRHGVAVAVNEVRRHA